MAGWLGGWVAGWPGSWVAGRLEPPPPPPTDRNPPHVQISRIQTLLITPDLADTSGKSDHGTKMSLTRYEV